MKYVLAFALVTAPFAYLYLYLYLRALLNRFLDWLDRDHPHQP